MINLIFKYKWLFIIILFVLFFLLVFPFNKKIDKIPFNDQLFTPTPIKTRQTDRVVPLQKTIIGETTKNEIEQDREIIKKEQITDNQTKYSLNSPLYPARANEIITENNTAVFERIITPKTSTLNISDYTSKYGAPEKIIQGSKFYDWDFKTYIYAQRGFSFIANPNTQEIFELHVFSPTSVENYIQNYGQDLNPNASPSKDGFVE